MESKIWLKPCLNRFGFLLIGLLLTHGCYAVEIRRLVVPRWIQNGTEDYIVLDCDYVYNENDFRLVVKWFFEDNLEPVYQWIPELNRKHTSGILQNRLDLNFEINTMDSYSRFRALRIPRPSIELSGKYTCLVSSLAGQDSREQVMTVFVPAHEFELGYVETGHNSVNVSCKALGVFPSPVLRLYLRPSSGSPPQAVTDIKLKAVMRPSGAYDAIVYRTFKINEIFSKGATVFECVLELPGTNYVQSKRIAYFPGIQGQRIEVPHGLSSSGTSSYDSTNKRQCLFCFAYILFTYAYTHVRIT
ncbi:uncharacterized protein LOC129234578 [Uloborus diversus]|uniref:uncharacterized protein LOC129234578 n=1 Tax=Uloborus diversus TaxID=327109 RepID=UPI00240A61D2|nr:uncharacterized protein LOC129234578 [Uloborus diversus]